MISIYNQVQLIGRAGHDVEFLEFGKGQPRANLRLYEKQHRAGPQQAHVIIAWGTLAEQLFAKVRRGDQLLVQGRLVNRRLEQSGFSFVRTEVHLDHFTVLTHKRAPLHRELVSAVAEPKAK